MIMHTRTFVSLFATTGVLLLASCGLIDWDKLIEQDPTKTRMEGVWQVTEAYNEAGDDILDKISFPVTAFQLSSNNSIASTAGPMMMYVVYGGSKYTEIGSKIDQVFDYTQLKFTDGEWFIDGGVVSRFTLEMKLEGLPGQSSLTTLLGLLGIGGDYLDVTVYHKFRDVKVSLEDGVDSVMTWEFDDSTTAVYNTKDKYGDNVLWNGFNTNLFAHCTFVLTKRVKTINDLVNDAKN